MIEKFLFRGTNTTIRSANNNVSEAIKSDSDFVAVSERDATAVDEESEDTKSRALSERLESSDGHEKRIKETNEENRLLEKRDAAKEDNEETDETMRTIAESLESEGDETRSKANNGNDDEEEIIQKPDETISASEDEIVKTPKSSTTTAFDMARKAGVAVSGAALTGIGIVMIPLPTPFGCVVAASGMAVLGTEFPAAQKVLDDTRDAVVRTLEQNCLDDENTNEDAAVQDFDNDDFVVVEKPGSTSTKVTEKENANNNDTTRAWIPARLKKAGRKLGQNAIPILKSLGSSSTKGEEDFAVSTTGKDNDVK